MACYSMHQASFPSHNHDGLAVVNDQFSYIECVVLQHGKLYASSKFTKDSDHCSAWEKGGNRNAVCFFEHAFSFTSLEARHCAMSPLYPGELT